jgi:hypothetical protein
MEKNRACWTAPPSPEGSAGLEDTLNFGSIALRCAFFSCAAARSDTPINWVRRLGMEKTARAGLPEAAGIIFGNSAFIIPGNPLFKIALSDLGCR